MNFKNAIYYIMAAFSIGFYVIYKFVEAFKEYGIGGVLAVLLIFIVGIQVTNSFKK